MDATFLNRPTVSQEQVDLTGNKKWNVTETCSTSRPGDLTLTLERMAPTQPGQNNQIEWETVSLGADAIQWSKQDNTWTYTITGLDRYAPNGMAWQYRVTETKPNQYTSTPASGTVLQKATDADGNVTMIDLTNSLQTSAGFRKIWVDGDGSPITENYLGSGVTWRCISGSRSGRRAPDRTAGRTRRTISRPI